ncbi:MAG: DUF3794 domain-containing protein [Ruminococcus sp.]|nr:DUF3794 domain-containing protein [Candidatus Apopatosoma intestinale]
MNMQNGNKDKNFCMMTKVFNGCSEKENTEKYDLPDYLPDVNKLLRVDARLVGMNRYVNGDTLEYDGSILYSILYATAQGEMRCASFESPVSGSMPVSGYEDGCLLDFNAAAENVTCRLQGPRKLTAKAKIRICAAIYCEKCTEPVFAGKLTPEERANMQYLYESIECETQESFEVRGNSVSEDIELPSGMPPVSEIISVDTDTYIYEMRPSEQGLSYKGDVTANILYSSKKPAENEEEAAENGGMLYASLVRKIPIYGDIPAETDETPVFCLGRAEITKLEYRPQENSLGESRIIEIDFDYDIFADCYYNEESNVVKDIYSLDYENGNEYSSLSFRNVAKAQTFNFSVNSTEQNSDAEFSAAVSTVASASVESVTKDSGKLIFEGKAEVSVILTNGDGLFIGKNYTVPLRAEADAGKTADNFTYAVTSAVIFAASRADSEKIATDLEIAIAYVTFNEYETLAVTQSTVYKDKPVYAPEHSAVVIYYPVKDEKLWGIAKKYNTTEDAIRRANGITGDYATGNMIVVPKK